MKTNFIFSFLLILCLIVGCQSPVSNDPDLRDSSIADTPNQKQPSTGQANEAGSLGPQKDLNTIGSKVPGEQKDLRTAHPDSSLGSQGDLNSYNNDVPPQPGLKDSDLIFD
ncbi:hypothetical protein K9M79_08470 [Candidatus Woesearchaeota archaeon]|nr:hypothetical protein [Candidatus Woesearchaeota archaeon]